MKQLILRELTIHDQEAYYDFILDMGQTGNITPSAADLKGLTFEAFLKDLEIKKTQRSIDRVPATLYVLADMDGYLYGAVSFRHELNSYLEDFGGHIGYGIRKSEQGKGYGTLQLKLMLDILKHLDYDYVLVTCDEDNIRSKKVIEHNGGRLEGKIYKHDAYVLRYYIDIKNEVHRRAYLLMSQKDDETHRITRKLSEMYHMPTYANQSINERLFDHQVRDEKLSIDLMKQWIDQTMESHLAFILDLKLSMIDYLDICKHLYSKKVDIKTILIDISPMDAYIKYQTHLNDLHPLHKIDGIYAEEVFFKKRYISYDKNLIHGLQVIHDIDEKSRSKIIENIILRG